MKFGSCNILNIGIQLGVEPEPLELRLVGGSSEFEGNVYYGDQPVCDDHWNRPDGEVVCRELGYGPLIRATSSSTFGTVSTNFIMDDVQCTGSESQLQDCTHSPNHNCGGNEGAGVVCTDPGEIH